MSDPVDLAPGGPVGYGQGLAVLLLSLLPASLQCKVFMATRKFAFRIPTVSPILYLYYVYLLKVSAGGNSLERSLQVSPAK